MESRKFTSRPDHAWEILSLTFENVTKGYGDRLLMDNFNPSIPAGCIVGVIGPNGAGKTTLLRMITGQEQPDSGTIQIGETVSGLCRSKPRNP